MFRPSYSYRGQVLFVLAFFLVNLALWGFSVDKEVVTVSGKTYSLSTTYTEASDGQRYWGTAMSLAEKGEFTMRDDDKIYENEISHPPLSRAGPLPALFFSLPIKLVGLDRASTLIVFLQCSLLFVMALAARGIAEPFYANKNLIQGLVLFNPNLIGLAHHAQSDILFACIFTLLLLIISKIIDKPTGLNLRLSIIVGLLAGLLPLARPLGAYCIIALPLFLFLVLWLKRKTEAIDWLKTLRLSLLSAVISIIILTPWAVRNYLVFDQLALTQSGAIQAQYYYRSLRAYGMPESNEAVHTYLVEHGHDPSCRESGTPGSGCENAVRNAYLYLIVTAPKTILIKALVAASGRTLLAGGTRNITDYLGMQTAAEEYNRLANLGWRNIYRFLVDIAQIHPDYLFLFSITILFAAITRGLGVLGLIQTISIPRCYAHTVFYLLVIVLFLSLNGFQGWSRYRAPLEPILMLFCAMAFYRSIIYNNSTD